jgi:hypothetical protein
MNIGVIIPVFVHTNPLLINATLDAASKLRSTHALHLYIACTRLHLITPEALQERLAAVCAFPVQVLYEPGVARSVAGAWNWGCREALRAGADYLVLTANDVAVEAECIDSLVAFGENPANARMALWSGIDVKNQSGIDPAAVSEGCDFACCMLRPETLEKHGWFDSAFRPAYAEDNDYYTRVILGGNEACMVHAARFVHHGSLTIRSDPEAAHHVNHWFEINIRRYRDKWGASQMPASKDEVLANCHRNPFGIADKPLTWWPEQDSPGWTPFDGMP